MPNCRTRSPISPKSAFTPCRPRATTPATSPRINGPAWRRARSRIPRIWSELLRQYTTLHPEFSFLPRKFKFAITASAHDRAAIKIHDIGLRLHKNAEGETGFEVLVGGGLGRTPFIGKTIKPFVPGRDLLSYVEAILRVYNQYGRRDNIYKARIKILVHELGIEKFAQEVEDEWQQMRDSALTLDDAVVEDIRSRFTYPAYEKLPHMPDELKKAAHDPLFEALAQEFGVHAQGARAMRS